MTKLEQEAIDFANTLYVVPGLSLEAETCIRLAARLGYCQGSMDAAKNYSCMRTHLEEIRFEPSAIDYVGIAHLNSQEDINAYSRLIKRMAQYENSYWHGTPYNTALYNTLGFFGIKFRDSLCPRCCADLKSCPQGEYCSRKGCNYAY